MIRFGDGGTISPPFNGVETTARGSPRAGARLPGVGTVRNASAVASVTANADQQLRTPNPLVWTAFPEVPKRVNVGKHPGPSSASTSSGVRSGPDVSICPEGSQGGNRRQQVCHGEPVTGCDHQQDGAFDRAVHRKPHGGCDECRRGRPRGRARQAPADGRRQQDQPHQWDK